MLITFANSLNPDQVSQRLVCNLIYLLFSTDWFPKEPNNGHIEYFLFLLAGLTVLNLGIFVIVAKFYKYRVPDFETRVEAKKINLQDLKNPFDKSVEGIFDEKLPSESYKTRL